MIKVLILPLALAVVCSVVGEVMIIRDHQRDLPTRRSGAGYLILGTVTVMLYIFIAICWAFYWAVSKIPG